MRRGDGEMEKITSQSQFEQVISEGKTIVVFSADWCPDCVFIRPFMPDVEKKYSEYRFYLVERDENIDLITSLDIFGIPSFIAFENGQEIGRFVNKDRKTQAQIEAFIEGL
ncbi:thioredoxin family protein [Massilibacterium senegalense]|uniref:thioredoxin family protein n=1 Tax=Massilibacterium senegalense TaxID=1632858 RepID=UPI002D77783B|nr:thioredoxin family protein [Massilibacterium senegalense]